MLECAHLQRRAGSEFNLFALKRDEVLKDFRNKQSGEGPRRIHAEKRKEAKLNLY